jgi:hypothetical protein
MRKFRCITPTAELLSKKETFKEVLDSHDWEMDKVDPERHDQILAKIHCSKCGLERIFIVSNIQESAGKAAKIREQEKLNQQL